MAKTETPICAFDWPAPDFSLLGTNGQLWTKNDIRGQNGLLIVFMCNHCPYVQSILDEFLEDALLLQKEGIGIAAVCSNDAMAYPDDSFEEMKKLARQKKFSFPYLHDESQETARKYGAVCTPDFFGFNQKDKLQYRGRHSATRMQKVDDARRDLKEAMLQVARTQSGPREQHPSLGCSIKWKN